MDFSYDHLHYRFFAVGYDPLTFAITTRLDMGSLPFDDGVPDENAKNALVNAADRSNQVCIPIKVYMTGEDASFLVLSYQGFMSQDLKFVDVLPKVFQYMKFTVQQFVLYLSESESTESQATDPHRCVSESKKRACATIMARFFDDMSELGLEPKSEIRPPFCYIDFLHNLEPYRLSMAERDPSVFSIGIGLDVGIEPMKEHVLADAANRANRELPCMPIKAYFVAGPGGEQRGPGVLVLKYESFVSEDLKLGSLLPKLFECMKYTGMKIDKRLKEGLGQKPE